MNSKTRFADSISSRQIPPTSLPMSPRLWSCHSLTARSTLPHSLNPAKSTARVDLYALIRVYFLKKWTQSLKKKQKLFPAIYDFADVLSLKSILAVTDRLLEKYSDFNSAAEYFREYSLLGDALKDLPVATTIITAKDDPIIPVEDFYHLELNHRTNLVIQTYGGHNGFIDGIFLKSWYEQKLGDLFDKISSQEGGQI